MERIGLSNKSSATKKKRSTTLRRPWNEPLLQDEDINWLCVNKIEESEAVESDEGGCHITASTQPGFTHNKVKLKLVDSSKSISLLSASAAASDIGFCSTKSSHASRIRQTNQAISNERSTKLRGTPLDTTSKADSCNDTRDSKSNTYPVRKSNRISKRRVLDEELEDDDEEIQFLKRLKVAKVVDEDEERSRKHKKISKVMKQNVDYLRGVDTSEKSGRKDKIGKAFDDADYVEDDDDDEESLSEAGIEPENKSSRTRRRAAEEGLSDLKAEMTVTTRRRSGHSGNLIEFPLGLPPAPPRKRKENGLEVDQQVKKAEAAQRRKMQVEKAARDSEAEAIRKILGQDSSRKKKEDKTKKRQEEKAKEKAAKSFACRSDTVKWVMGPSGTVVTFPEELGLPTIFNSRPQSYPPPRERCAGPECTNPYKYRDSESKLPLCNLRCYRAVKG